MKNLFLLVFIVFGTIALATNETEKTVNDDVKPETTYIINQNDGTMETIDDGSCVVHITVVDGDDISDFRDYSGC